jgi:hypothetical protein
VIGASIASSKAAFVTNIMLFVFTSTSIPDPSSPGIWSSLLDGKKSAVLNLLCLGYLSTFFSYLFD